MGVIVSHRLKTNLCCPCLPLLTARRRCDSFSHRDSVGPRGSWKDSVIRKTATSTLQLNELLRFLI